MIALLLSLALAAPPEPPAEVGVRVALRGVLEHHGDPSLGSLYRTGGVQGAVGVAAALAGPIGLDVEVAYQRQVAASSDANVFQLVPVTLLGTVSFGKGTVVPMAGLGPSLVSFSEKHPPDAAGVSMTAGSRLCVEVRGGVVVHTKLIDPPAPPADHSAVRGLDVEITLGRRLQRPFGKLPGFDVGGWRGAVGLGLRF